MPITQITDHEDQAEARLPEQFVGKDLMIALVRAHAKEVQEIEDAVFPMLDLLDIATQIGAQLDGIGDILTEARDGQNDADYRVALLAKGARFTASGTPEQVIERFIALTGSTPPVDLLENFPAGYDIIGDGTQPTGLLSAMEAVSGVGIYVGLLDFLNHEDDDGVLHEDGDTVYVTYESSGR